MKSGSGSSRPSFTANELGTGLYRIREFVRPRPTLRSRPPSWLARRSMSITNRRSSTGSGRGACWTGLTATPEQAEEVHAQIRSVLADGFGSDVSEAVRIQYGGSVKPDNADVLFSQANIDGGLIGGAALEAESFAGVVKGAVS